MNFVNHKVVPSYLGSRAMGTTAPAATHFDTTQLLIGEVKEIIEPSSTRSQTKLYKEYTVDVQYSSGAGPVTTVTFPNCLLINSLGGIADRTQFTLRADPSDPQGKKIAVNGSKVMVLCVGGDTSRAYIIGGIREDQVRDQSGHNAYFEFNGTSLSVAADGQTSLKVRGATNADGSPVDSKAGAVKNPTEFKVSKNSDLECSVGSQITIRSATKGMEVNVKDNVRVFSAGVLFGQATDAMVMGTTYRRAEAQMNGVLGPAFQSLATLATTIGVNLTAASTAMKIPVAGAVAANVPMQLAAQAASQMVALLTNMAQAINGFEASPTPYLSKTHKLD